MAAGVGDMLGRREGGQAMGVKDVPSEGAPCGGCVSRVSVSPGGRTGRAEPPTALEAQEAVVRSGTWGFVVSEAEPCREAGDKGVTMGTRSADVDSGHRQPGGLSDPVPGSLCQWMPVSARPRLLIHARPRRAARGCTCAVPVSLARALQGERFSAARCRRGTRGSGCSHQCRRHATLSVTLLPSRGRPRGTSWRIPCARLAHAPAGPRGAHHHPFLRAQKPRGSCPGRWGSAPRPVSRDRLGRWPRACLGCPGCSLADCESATVSAARARPLRVRLEPCPA